MNYLDTATTINIPTHSLRSNFSTSNAYGYVQIDFQYWDNNVSWTSVDSFELPTISPTRMPTYHPTLIPTTEPSHLPTGLPTAVPTTVPTAFPTTNTTAPTEPYPFELNSTNTYSMYTTDLELESTIADQAKTSHVYNYSGNYNNNKTDDNPNDSKSKESMFQSSLSL